jgi:hypothetical protein
MPKLDDLSDAELAERYATARDAELVTRDGPI